MMLKPFYVSSDIVAGSYELRARDCRPRKGYNPATVVLAQFAKYRRAQDVANMMNSALATWSRLS